MPSRFRPHTRRCGSSDRHLQTALPARQLVARRHPDRGRAYRKEDGRRHHETMESSGRAVHYGLQPRQPPAQVIVAVAKLGILFAKSGMPLHEVQLSSHYVLKCRTGSSLSYRDPNTTPAPHQSPIGCGPVRPCRAVSVARMRRSFSIVAGLRAIAMPVASASTISR